MSSLHDALESLGGGSPTPFDDIPVDNLSDFMQQVLRDAEFAANSLPLPPGGAPFADATLTRTDSTPATSAAGMTPSDVRPPPPPPEVEELRGMWGKPLKIAPRDNVLGIPVYKMAGHDRHGAWFGRRSIHEGMSFDHWKRAMEIELSSSLAVEGGPGAGAVRGLGVDTVIERRVVEGAGRAEVFQLSMAFPGPASPRDFVTLLLTTSSDERTPSGDVPGRTYMLVSIPVDHSLAPPRQGLIRGYYESVELIREIPMSTRKSQSQPELQNLLHEDGARGRPRASTDAHARSRSGRSADPTNRADRNPVEWIMITRSDPGGGIPRFMVERGTPGSIAQDATKFVDWACRLTEEDFQKWSSEKDQIETETLGERDEGAEPHVEKEEQADGLPGETPSRELSNDGIFATLSSRFEGLAPAVAHKFLFHGEEPEDDDSSDTDTSSGESFASARQWTSARSRRSSSAQSFKDADLFPDSQQSSLASCTPDQAALDSSQGIDKEEARLRIKHAKELSKLEQKGKDIEAKLRTAESHLIRAQGGNDPKAKEAAEKEVREVTRQRERNERDVAKQQQKQTTQLDKLQHKRERERQKREARRQKEEEKDATGRLRRDRDQWRRLCELVKKENEILKSQVEELQRENTMMVGVLGKSEDGREILKRMKTEGWGLVGAKTGAGLEDDSAQSDALTQEESKKSSKT